MLGHYFAVLAAASLAATLGVLDQARRAPLTLLLAILFGGFAVGTVLSGARSSLIGLGVGLLVATALYSWRLAVDRGRVRSLASGPTISRPSTTSTARRRRCSSRVR